MADDAVSTTDVESDVELLEAASTPKVSSSKPRLGRAFYLGVCYGVVLCGYYTANSFVSKLYGKVYFIGWSLLYFFYFCSSFVAPSLGHYLPIKPSMIGCAVIYVLYIACVNSGVEAIFLVASSVVGISAGIFWLKSSEWIALESQKQNGGAEGVLTGAFYGVFYFQGILGCTIALLILFFNANTSLLIWCMCGLTAIGLVMTLFVPTSDLGAALPDPPSLKEKLKSLVKSSSQTSVLLMIPLMFLQSAQVCFSYQFLPKLIEHATIEHDFPFVNVSTFFVYWTGSIIVSFSYGKLFDKFGWKLVLVCVAVVELLSIVSALPLMLLTIPSPFLWMIVGFFRGVSDTGTNAFILATITFRYGPVGSASPLFGLYRGLYSLGFFVLGIATALISPFFLIGGLSVLLIVGSICFILSFKFPAL